MTCNGWGYCTPTSTVHSFLKTLAIFVLPSHIKLTKGEQDNRNCSHTVERVQAGKYVLSDQRLECPSLSSHIVCAYSRHTDND